MRTIGRCVEMNDILVTFYQILAWGALIGGIGGIAFGIYGLIRTKRENKIKLAVNNFTNVTWKDGDEMQRTVFSYDYQLEALQREFPQFMFKEEYHMGLDQVWIDVFGKDSTEKLASFKYDKNDLDKHAGWCLDKVADWCSNYIPQETCCEDRLEPKPMKPMTCEKCGAPLKGCECEYCGTRYYIPNNEYETLYADSKAIMQIKKNLSEVQNMADQLRILGGNGSIEYMLNSGAINAATAREMYMTKMVNHLID